MRKSAQTRTTLSQSKVKEKAQAEPDESLAKVQKDLRAAQAEAKRERQARLQAERALTEAQEKLVAARLGAERESQLQTRRVSFVVRLTLDKQGQFSRTEIEHVSSGRKQNFRSLDGDLLVDFMKACVNPEIIPADAIPTKPC